MIVMLFAIYALSYILRNLSGPFNILGKIRNWLLSNKYFGVFFYELLNCPWCLGFHCGYIIYIFSDKMATFTDLMLWSLAGSAVVAFGDRYFQKNYN